MGIQGLLTFILELLRKSTGTSVVVTSVFGLKVIDLPIRFIPDRRITLE